jgi:hypothetical protein
MYFDLGTIDYRTGLNQWLTFSRKEYAFGFLRPAAHR